MGLQAVLIKLLNVIILFSGITGFIQWREIKGSYWRWFPFYLVAIAFFSTLGSFLSDKKYLAFNQGLFVYLVIPFEFLFAFWLLFKKAETKGQKALILSGTGVYLLCFILEAVIKGQKGAFFPTISYTVGNIFLLLFILFYFWKLSVSTKILFFYRERMFWVSAGMLFFWLGSLPYYGLFNFLYENHRNILNNYAWVMLSLNYLMYTFFVISFVWGKEN